MDDGLDDLHRVDTDFPRSFTFPGRSPCEEARGQESRCIFSDAHHDSKHHIHRIAVLLWRSHGEEYGSVLTDHEGTDEIPVLQHPD